MKCNLCPRKCNADREKQEGVCRMPWDIYAARAALHMWEEPCISGENGSGAVFFYGLYPAVRILPESRNCRGKTWTED